MARSCRAGTRLSFESHTRAEKSKATILDRIKRKNKTQSDDESVKVQNHAILASLKLGEGGGGRGGPDVLFILSKTVAW